MGFEVPASVVTVTGTDEEPLGDGGTFTVHEEVKEQLVGMATPPNRAKTCPLGLIKFAPVMTTV
jgi:hypothetical protein